MHWLSALDQISNIVEAYYNLCKDTAGDVGEKLRTMRLNLKTIEQKISNIVNVIANTGSAALANQLMLLENEKEVLDFQIREEERNAEQSRLDETEIIVAFRQAQQMFRSGELPQMEQIINLYLDRVNVYPEYVEIHINNVPTSIVNTVQTKKEPAISGLHTFSIEKIAENSSTTKCRRKIGQYQGKIAIKLQISANQKNLSDENGQKETRAQSILDSSKSGGAEGNRTPVRRQLDKTFSERSLLFTFPLTGGNKHPPVISSFMMHGMGKAYHTHGLHSNHTRARLVDLPGRMRA